MNEQGVSGGGRTASNAGQVPGAGQRAETASQRGPPRLNVKGTDACRGRKGLKEESAGANTQRRNQTQSRELSNVAGISGVCRETRAGEAETGPPQGRERPEAFPGRAWKTRGKAACRRVCPDPEEPAIGPSAISPPAAQLWHFYSPQERPSRWGGVGSRDPPPPAPGLKPQTLHLRAVRPTRAQDSPRPQSEQERPQISSHPPSCTEKTDREREGKQLA